MGINLGRRIYDLLALKIGDVLNENNTIKNFIIFHEHKTNKNTKVYINQNVKDVLNLYLNTKRIHDENEYIFKSRKGDKAITPNMAWIIISSLEDKVGIQANLGTHSMRKTFAYNAFMLNKNDQYTLAKVSEALNHSSQAITRRYIGLDDEEMKDLYMSNLL
jgi:integrase